MPISFIKKAETISAVDFSTMRLETERLYLRAPQERDEEEWLDIREASRDFLEPWEPSWPKRRLLPRDYRNFFKARRKKWRKDQGYSFFLFTRDRDNLIGSVNINNVVRGVAQFASLGYWIGAPYHSQGYMTEAVAAVTCCALDDLSLHKVTASCIPGNIASQKVLEKLGFEKEGLARRHLKIAGRWQDHITYGILASDPRPIA